MQAHQRLRLHDNCLDDGVDRYHKEGSKQFVLLLRASVVLVLFAELLVSSWDVEARRFEWRVRWRVQMVGALAHAHVANCINISKTKQLTFVFLFAGASSWTSSSRAIRRHVRVARPASVIFAFVLHNDVNAMAAPDAVD